MANVKIHCPNCHQEYDVDETDLGHEAECQACKKTFILQVDVASPEAPSPQKTKTTVSVEKKSTLKHMKCEMCGGSDLVKQDGLFVCQHCGAKYSVEEAKKMMVESDGDIVVSGTVKIDDNEKLANLYTLARREYNLENYQEALKYYEMIILDDPNNWEPVFGISFIKIGHGDHKWEDLARELDTFTKKLDESVKLLENSEDENEIKRVLREVIIPTVSNVTTVHMNGIQNMMDTLKIHDRWDEANQQHYINITNNLALLLEKMGDICHKDLSSFDKSKLRFWKSAIECTSAEVIHNRIAVKLMNEDPGYRPPPVKQVGKGCSVFLSLLVIIFVVFGILFFIALRD